MHGLWEEREPEENRLGNYCGAVGGGLRKETADLVGKLELGFREWARVCHAGKGILGCRKSLKTIHKGAWRSREQQEAAVC